MEKVNVTLRLDKDKIALLDHLANPTTGIALT